MAKKYSSPHRADYRYYIFYSKKVEGSKEGAKLIEQALIFATRNSNAVSMLCADEQAAMKSLRGCTSAMRVFLVGVDIPLRDFPDDILKTPQGICAIKIIEDESPIYGLPRGEVQVINTTTKREVAAQRSIHNIVWANNGLRNACQTIATAIRDDICSAISDWAIVSLVALGYYTSLAKNISENSQSHVSPIVDTGDASSTNPGTTSRVLEDTTSPES